MLHGVRVHNTLTFRRAMSTTSLAVAPIKKMMKREAYVVQRTYAKTLSNPYFSVLYVPLWFVYLVLMRRTRQQQNWLRLVKIHC